MMEHDISTANDKDLAASLIAMQRAAHMARALAIQTNTALIRFIDGKIVHVGARALQLEIEAEAANARAGK